MPLRQRLNGLTLTQQWLIATLLAILPLLLAVGYAVWSLAEQTEQHRRLLLSMSALKDLDAAVGRQIGGLERTSLQFALIGDEKFRELYYERLQTLRDFQRELVFTLPKGDELNTLNQIIDRVAGFDAHLNTNRDELSIEAVRKDWQDINNLGVELSEQVDSLTRKSILESEQRIETVIQRLLLIGAFTIPATALLLTLSTVTVTRPVRRLTNAVQQLGKHQWDKPVSIEGPVDFSELGERLEWMREQLLTSDRQKQAFLRHITHELKSPLAAISQAESLLHDEVPGNINDAQRHVLDILRNNANSLSELIQQLLNYNAVKHSLTPDLREIDISSECEKVWKRVSASHNRNIDCHWRTENNSNTIVTDPVCLDMVLSNFLSNARDLVPDNGKISIRWGADEKHWWMSVDDNGPGISEEEAKQIFKPFFQGTARRQGPLKGSGIGLSIVQECVDRLRGEIKVTRSPLGGARFYLTFPK